MVFGARHRRDAVRRACARCSAPCASRSIRAGRAERPCSRPCCAQNGFTSSDARIEAPRGFAHVLSTKFDPHEITGELGTRWEISLNTYKPFACGIVIHPAIDGCVQLRDAHG